MQKITIIATTLNEAMQEVKKRFGEDVIIESTEEFNNQIRITIALFDKGEAIIVPSLRQAEQIISVNVIGNPLLAIRFVEEICNSHYLGKDFQDFWLKCLSSYSNRTEINLAESLAECLNFETQWIRKAMVLKPIVFLGSYGVGKTQILAKTAALLKASDRSVEIYNLDTFKTSGQGMLQAYAAKLGVPYYFGKDALTALKTHTKKQEKAVKLIDTQGVALKNSKDLDWLETYSQKLMFDPVLVVPCDSSVSLVDDYAHFAKKFRVRNLILSKMDIAASLGLPVRLAWCSEIPIAMVNHSASLGDNLRYLDAEKLINHLVERSVVDQENNRPLSKLTI